MSDAISCQQNPCGYKKQFYESIAIFTNYHNEFIIIIIIETNFFVGTLRVDRTILDEHLTLNVEHTTLFTFIHHTYLFFHFKFAHIRPVHT